MSGNASAARNRRTSSPSTTWRIPTASRSIARLRITSTSCTRSSSSNASRRRAFSLSAIVSGRWMSWRACQRSISASRWRTAAGTGSARPRGPGLLQGILDPAGDLPRVQLRLLRLRVDRHDAPGAVTDQVDDRVRHLEAAAVRVDLPVQGDLQARRQLALPPRLVEEHDVQLAAVVADHRLHHRAPVAHLTLLGRAHRRPAPAPRRRAGGRGPAPRSCGPPSAGGRWSGCRAPSLTPTAASDSCLRSPTPFSRATGMASSSRRVSGCSSGGTAPPYGGPVTTR